MKSQGYAHATVKANILLGAIEELNSNRKKGYHKSFNLHSQTLKIHHLQSQVNRAWKSTLLARIQMRFCVIGIHRRANWGTHLVRTWLSGLFMVVSCHIILLNLIECYRNAFVTFEPQMMGVINLKLKGSTYIPPERGWICSVWVFSVKKRTCISCSVLCHWVCHREGEGKIAWECWVTISCVSLVALWHVPGVISLEREKVYFGAQFWFQSWFLASLFMHPLWNNTSWRERWKSKTTCRMARTKGAKEEDYDRTVPFEGHRQWLGDLLLAPSRTV